MTKRDAIILVSLIGIIIGAYGGYQFLYDDKDTSSNAENQPIIVTQQKKNISDFIFTDSSSGLPGTGDYNYLDLGDIDKDGDLDMVAGAGGWAGITTHGLHVYLNDGKGTWTISNSGLPATGTYSCVKLVDLNKDSNLDLLVTHERWAAMYSSSPGEGLDIYLGDGKGGWSQGQSPYTSNHAGEFAIEDINKDGRLDIAMASQSDGVKVWFQNSGNTWTEKTNGLPTTNEFTGLTLGDINNDGFLDIAVSTYNAGGGGRGVHIYKGDGKGNWEDKSDTIKSITSRAGMGLDLVDFNGDNKLDLIYNSVNGGLQTFTGNGNFQWSEVTQGLPSYGVFIMSDIRDIDSNGIIDFISGTSGGGLNLFTWSGSGWLQISGNGLSDQGIYYTPVFGDLDGDGDLDIACATIMEGLKVWMAS